MDSERYSDFNALKTEHDRPFDRPYEPKGESRFHKDVMEALGNIFAKLVEVDGNIGSRLEECLACVSSAKAENPKILEEPVVAEIPVQYGGSLEQIVASEVNQLLFDLQSLQKEVTESDQNITQVAHSSAVVQSGSCNCETDFKGRFTAMQCVIDVLKQDVHYLTENMSHLLTYICSRSSKNPMKLKAGTDGGRVVFRAEPK